MDAAGPILDKGYPFVPNNRPYFLQRDGTAALGIAYFALFSNFSISTFKVLPRVGNLFSLQIITVVLTTITDRTHYTPDIVISCSDTGFFIMHTM